MTKTDEGKLRERIVRQAHSLKMRGYAPGSSGNISVRLDDGILITPTNSSMGDLEPERIAKVDWEGRHISGDPPSKEGFLHLAMYRQRPDDRATVHLHSTHSVALSCLEGLDPACALPPITAYSVMRVGRLALVPYYRPGDRKLADAVAALADRHHALLLANHGPVVSGSGLEDAIYRIEELEETARLHFLLEGRPARLLTAEQIADIERAFPS